MTPTPEEILSDVARNLLRPHTPATLALDRPVIHLPRPAASHADWRGLSAAALGALFRHLPVPDLLRLGYLFTPRWREVWRTYPLYLHDKQFASLPIPRSEVADAIANVLDEFLHGFQGEGEGEGEGVAEEEDVHLHRCGVTSFRVESTEWRPDHAARWCAALQRGGPSEVVLFNRGVAGQPPALISVPPLLLQCTTVSNLHLAFFTVEAGELDALTKASELGLHGCACRPGVVEGVVAACSHLRMLWVQDCALDSVVVRSAPRLSMLRTASRSLTVDDAPKLSELLPGSTAALCISGAPKLTSLLRFILPATLDIDGVEIGVGRQEMQPQMPSVSNLWLALDYTALRGMGIDMVARVVQQMLRRFPCLKFLTIERTDAVPREEGMATRYDQHAYYLDLDGGLDQCLHYLTLFDFRGGKAELELLMAIMDSTRALWTVNLAYSSRRMGPQLWHATKEALAAEHVPLRS